MRTSHLFRGATRWGVRWTGACRATLGDRAPDGAPRGSCAALSTSLQEKKKRKFKEACMRKKFARNAQRNQQRFNTGM
jgi:hypothetical protein